MSEKLNEAVSVGQTVCINPRNDRSREKRITGVVAEVLTKNLSHPHGILVKLNNGEVGRVKAETREIPQKPIVGISAATTTVESLLKAGENHSVEFKTDALWSAKYSAEDIKNHRPQTSELHVFGKAASKVIIAKTLAAFLNSDGGHLVIGFKEGKNGLPNETVGVDVEFAKLKDPSIDGYRRMITEIVKDYFPSFVFNMFNNHFKISFEELDGKILCVVTVKKSEKRVFLKLQKKDYFFVRIDASTRELQGEQILEYCDSRFTQ